MKNRQYFKLDPSETAILQSAAQIFTGYIIAGLIKDGNEDKFMDMSVAYAVNLSRKLENLIQSDDETGHGG